MGARLIAISLATAALSLLTSAAAAASDAVSVRVKNPLAAPRSSATIALRLAEIRKLAPALDPAKTVVVDRHGSAARVAAGRHGRRRVARRGGLAGRLRRGRSEDVHGASRGAPSLRARRLQGLRPVRARAARRLRVGERSHRAPHVRRRPRDAGRRSRSPAAASTSGPSELRKLVVNDWYMVDNYHQDNGDGGDFYSVGKSRGCGGLGIWQNGKLYVSRNFVTLARARQRSHPSGVRARLRALGRRRRARSPKPSA